ncbi:MAG: HAMP domain-containing protein, partial [Leptospiraceae bacterium]|nr:HAMP domain-containing protein [Leptospiraceae bacterium]
EFLKENQLTEKELENLINLHGSKFLKSFSGAAVVHNASPGFKIPILGISLPLASDSDEKMIIVMFIRLEKLLTAFQASGITETFMVNDEGSVVAHPDSKVVLSGSNLIDNPIVKAMMTSTLDNGQTRYKDKDGVYHLGSFKKLGIAGAGIVSTVSEDRAFEAVYNIQKRNIYIMIIAVCFAILVVYFFARSMTTPIQRLLGATKQIESGDFRVTIHPETGDEIGILTHSFIDMGKGLEEKEKVKSILGGMIDPTVVKEAMVDLAALKRGSEKEITAFFSDVAGFSTISEQLVSVDLAALLNEYLGAMTIILKNHDGVLDKYIGDAIVAIFNAPVDVPNHCLAAAKASLEMIQKLSDQRKYWTEHNMYCKDAQEMDVRIGLNTGLAKVGFMGTEKLASYTMMGDTVNLAARLEAAGKDYGVNILISETVNARVKEEMFTRELDLVRVKGKNEPVRLYELIAKRSEIADNIAESALLYEEGLNHYLKHEWDKAIEKLEKAEKVKGKKDKAAHQLIDRCEDYKKHPPGKDWDGVFTRTHK